MISLSDRQLRNRDGSGRSRCRLTSAAPSCNGLMPCCATAAGDDDVRDVAALARWGLMQNAGSTAA